MMHAVVFPGQGSQVVGMGKDLCEFNSIYQEKFNLANKILGYDLTKICFEGPQETLNLSNYAQLGIFVSSVVCFDALNDQNLENNFDYFGGHSLGEWTALHLSGVTSFTDTIKILQARGNFMQEACESTSGAMLAVINLDTEKIIKIANETNCFIANFNSLSQTVLSGSTSAIEKAEKIVISEGAKRAIRLPVAGAFHSPLMKEASEKMKKFLDNIELHPPKIPVISNVTGDIHKTETIFDSMVDQITSSVQWVDCVQKLSSLGVKKIIECGPGQVLSGLIKRIDNQIEVRNISKLSDFEN